MPPGQSWDTAWEGPRLARGGGAGPQGEREQAGRYRFGDYLFDTERYELHGQACWFRCGPRNATS
jgi:hypothetical protein